MIQTEPKGKQGNKSLDLQKKLKWGLDEQE